MRAHPMIFVVLPALAWMPFDVIAEFATAQFVGRTSGDNLKDMMQQLRLIQQINNLGNLIVGFALMGTFAHALREISLGNTPKVGSSVAAGFSFWRPVIGVSILSGFLGVLAMLAFIVPGIYLLTCWALVIPVIVFEQHRGYDALKRSRELVRSRGFFTVLGYTAAFYLVYLVLSLTPSMLVSTAFELTNTPEPWFISALTTIPVNIVTSALVIGAVFLYVDASDTRALTPVGSDLLTDSGQRLPPPRTTGRPGLIIATFLAAVSLAFISVSIVAAFGEDELDGEPHEWLESPDVDVHRAPS